MTKTNTTLEAIRMEKLEQERIKTTLMKAKLDNEQAVNNQQVVINNTVKTGGKKNAWLNGHLVAALLTGVWFPVWLIVGIIRTVKGDD